MSSSHIVVKGARTHNLKNIDVKIPRDKFVVITGVSGSGKSSLAFDTIYAEGQRRYVESLSSYARQFLQMMDKPDVDSIDGLSPAISIEQKTTSHNPRSTVGTVTEIYDYLRLLFARIGKPFSPTTGNIIEKQSPAKITEEIIKKHKGKKLYIMAPVVRGRKGEHKDELSLYEREGYERLMVDGVFFDNTLDVPKLKKNLKHDIAIVIDRIMIKDEIISEDLYSRIFSSIESALRVAEGIVWVYDTGAKETFKFSEHFMCPETGFTIEEIEPRIFSFNNPSGACENCIGLGVEKYFSKEKIVNYEKSIKGGAVISLVDANEGVFRMPSLLIYYQKLLEALADKFGFSKDLPFSALSEESKNIIFYGTGTEEVNFLIKGKNKDFNFKKPFDGLISILKKRANELEGTENYSFVESFLFESVCSLCSGGRLKKESLAIKIMDKNIFELTKKNIKELSIWFNNLILDDRDEKVGTQVIKEITARLNFLMNVGLDYLTLSRASSTLSGGESQRIRLASQIGSGLTGVLYVLDEPSIGLHQRDNERLIGTLKNLRDLGNSVIVVEHDEDAIRAADWVIDIGKEAGTSGGNLVAEGTAEEIENNFESLTGDYLSGRKKIEVPTFRRPIIMEPELSHENDDDYNLKDPLKLIIPKNKLRRFGILKKENNILASRGGENFDKESWGKVPFLKIFGANKNNLKNINVKIPLGRLVCVTGVSGSGKSSLIVGTLLANLSEIMNPFRISSKEFTFTDCKKISGIDSINKIIAIDQTPIGRTPRSNPLTYVGGFTAIRELFAKMPESQARGYLSGRFSFNVKGGRCENCKGDGVIKIEMHFLSDVYVECEICKGKRYNGETLLITYKEKNISEVLKMTIADGVKFFENQKPIYDKIKCLNDVGLGYLKIGHSATTLSGGEAQRVKLAKELTKKATGKTLYIMDEPTTGLHFHDIKKLIEIINLLVDEGNSVIIIEHNLDVIKCADWIIEVGREGGEEGGHLIAEGPPELILEQNCYTGKYLKNHIKIS